MAMDLDTGSSNEEEIPRGPPPSVASSASGSNSVTPSDEGGWYIPKDIEIYSDISGW